MKSLRIFVVACFAFVFPTHWVFWLLNLLGNGIHPRARIGFSFIRVGILTMKAGAKIGHGNLITTTSVQIEEEGYIGNFNNIVGPIEILLRQQASIGNGNRCYRAPEGVTYGKSVLEFGILSKLTANHRVDCTRSIIVGDYSTIAGSDTQLWTHSYYHDRRGAGRFRLDGEIKIGNNTYIGSQSVLNAGIVIVDNVTVGSNSSVSKSLLKPGTYVSQALRYFDMPSGDQRMKFVKVEGYNLCEEVYERKNATPE